MMLAVTLAEEAEHNLLLPAPADLIWGSIAFVIVALVVGKLAWPTFMEMLDERKTKIEDGLAAAANAKEEMAGEREALADEINNAHREAAQIRNQAKDNAVEIARTAKADAASDAERITSNAQRQIEVDATSAKKALEQQIGTLAVDLAEKIVGAQALDPDISRDVIDRFLDDLEAQNAQLAKAEIKEN
ncbi:MAG: F0F1 ATP synthase subunit B [Ancrocorticia populi]|uniref:F0F1 ATP synthase subunit B n=1 Tax=Ancrocorticia populi TaxID=2175228 RepID=UPI003F8E9100